MRRVTKYPRYHSNCTPFRKYPSSGSNKPYALTRQSREGSNPARQAVSSFQLRSYKQSVPSLWLAPTATSLRDLPAALSVIVFMLFDCGTILPYLSPEVKKKFAGCPTGFRPPQRAEPDSLILVRTCPAKTPCFSRPGRPSAPYRAPVSADSGIIFHLSFPPTCASERTSYMELGPTFS